MTSLEHLLTNSLEAALEEKSSSIMPSVNLTSFVDDVDHVAHWLSFAAACGAIVMGSAIAIAGARAVRGSLLLFGCLFGASFFGLLVQTTFGGGRMAAFAAVAGGAIVGVAAITMVRFGLFLIGGAFAAVLIMASVHLGFGSLFFTTDARFWAAVGVVIVVGGVLGLVYRDGLMLLTTSYSGTLFVVLGASHLAGAGVDVQQLLWNPRDVVVCQRAICIARFVAWVVVGAAAAMGQHFVAERARREAGEECDGERGYEYGYGGGRRGRGRAGRHVHGRARIAPASSRAYQNRLRTLGATSRREEEEEE